METLKTCTQCKEAKAISCFTFRTDANYYRSKCKACVSHNSKVRYHEGGGKAKAKAYAEKNKDRLIAKRKADHIKNRDVVNKRSAAYLETNRDAINKRKRKYYAENREAIAAVRKASYDADPEKVLSRGRAYRAKDPERWRKHANKKAKIKRDANAKQNHVVAVKDSEGNTLKKCIKCGDLKRDHSFVVRVDTGKLRNTCKACDKKRLASPEHLARRNATRQTDENKAKTRKYKVDNKDVIASQHKEYYLRKKNDEGYVTHSKMSCLIRMSLKKGTKGGETWPKLVGYTLDQLIKHLKKTIPTGYTWEDYLTGALHLDHIVPVSVHNFETPQDADFKKAWALSNLQLLTAFDNLSKGAKIDKPFQPSLIGV